MTSTETPTRKAPPTRDCADLGHFPQTDLHGGYTCHFCHKPCSRDGRTTTNTQTKGERDNG